MVGSATVARIWGLSHSQATRYAKMLGLRPTEVRGPGGKHYRWSTAQLFAGLVAPVLDQRVGVGALATLACVQRIGSLTDEVLEAQITDGRHFLLVCRGGVMPDLLPRGAVETVQRERAGVLAELGLVLTVVDIAPLYADLVARLGQLREEGANVE